MPSQGAGEGAVNVRLIAALLAIFLAWWTFFLVGGLPMTDPRVLVHTVPILAAWLLGGAAVHGFARIYLEARRDAGGAPGEGQWHRLAEYAAGGVSLVIAEYFLLSLFVLVDPAVRATWHPLLVNVHVATLIIIALASLGYFYVASRHLLALRRAAAPSPRDGEAAGDATRG